jgi:hypothetical protein|tara:strand:- start:50 stop:271 length:222 start_codon:yes stop_codon:yes gene_type:complete
MSQDIWVFGDGLHKVYTESDVICRELVHDCKGKLSTTYYKDGDTFAWDVVVKDAYLSKAKKIIRGSVANKSTV